MYTELIYDILHTRTHARTHARMNNIFPKTINFKVTNYLSIF